MGQSGSLEKLTIKGFKKGDFSQPSGEFSVLINPEKYTRNFQICYADIQTPGNSSGTPEYNLTKSDTIDMELVFDATGVVPSPIAGVDPAPPEGIAGQIEKFLLLVFDYKGSTHSPNFLRLNWGKFLFECRLTKLKLDYTLFKPDGSPLRAKAAATFVEYTNKVELAKEQADESADMSHVVTVKAGDTLPLMCYELYGTSIYYTQVAAVNGLTDFRDLSVGSRLLFPPLASEV